MISYIKENNPIILDTAQKIEKSLSKLDLSIKNKSVIEPYIIEPNEKSMLNDRMQYQQGSFLLLVNDSLNKESVYNQKDITIVKYILSIELLNKLFRELTEKHNQYTSKYLYDPYLLFKNINVKDIAKFVY